VGRALASRGFLCLLATQTLGTLNDNMFRWLAVPIGSHMLGGTEQAGIAALSWGIFWFTLPYLVLPTHAGWLADRFSKRSVIVWCKVAEIVVMLLAWGRSFLKPDLPVRRAVSMAPGGKCPPGREQFRKFCGSKTRRPERTDDMATIVASAAGMVDSSCRRQRNGESPGNRYAGILTAVAIAGWLTSPGTPASRRAPIAPDRSIQSAKHGRNSACWLPTTP
jgi:MFS family permease